MQSESGEAALPAASMPVALPRPGWRAIAGGAMRVAYSLVGLLLFIFALELLTAGATGLEPVLSRFSADGVANLLGFGWLGSYVVMSGSPVAAISLSLFASGTTSDLEAFAMINGSRLGASLIVLFVGFGLWVTHKRSADGLYIGVVALLTAFTLWLPALPLGILALKSGWFDGVSLGTPGAVTSFVEVVYDPLVNRIADNVSDLMFFGLGIGVLMLAFTVFDRALPNLESGGSKSRLERVREWFHRPLPMLGLGMAVTAITLSVSISLTLLIPLSLKGYIRRNAIIPYVMGANITTWVDTMVAALLLDSPRAFTIVFTQMVVGGVISLVV
ncbi:MAG TPA: hypothetical protein VIW01_12780, partial [Dehalococcoidia bacterium]